MVRFILMTILTTYLVYITHKLVQDRGIKLDQKQLYDTMHTVLPDWSDYEWVRDILLFVPLLIIIVYGGNKRLMEFFRYYLLIVLVRCLTVTLTALPPCKYNEDPRRVTGIALIKGTPYDLMFSGHMAFWTISMLMILKYNLFPEIKCIIPMLIMMYGILILLVRAHYSIDVIISFLLSYFIFTSKIHI